MGLEGRSCAVNWRWEPSGAARREEDKRLNFWGKLKNKPVADARALLSFDSEAGCDCWLEPSGSTLLPSSAMVNNECANWTRGQE